MARIFREQQAKQGRSGRRVLIILLCGIVLALAAWGLAELIVPGQDAPDAPAVDAPASPTEPLPPAQ